MATLPPALINKLEELKKKTQQNKLLRETQEKEALADKKPVIKFSSALASVNLGGTDANPSSQTVNESPPSQQSLVSYDPDETTNSTSKPQNDLDTPKSDIPSQQASSEIPVPAHNLPSESIDRKEERRRKAALFLQRLKPPIADKENSVDTQPPPASQLNNEQALSPTVNSDAKNQDLTSEEPMEKTQSSLDDDSGGLRSENGDGADDTKEIVAGPNSNR